jgi:Domain of unknown function (DUF222)
MPIERSGSLSTPVAERSPYAMSRDALDELIDASVRAQSVEAMNAAMRIDLIFLSVSAAVRNEEAFAAPTLSPQRRREMAHRAVTADLATALRLPERTMERLVSDAWTLSTALPATLRAMRAGDITLQHARVVVEETTGLDDDPRLRARLDEQLAVVAVTATAATLRRNARALREQLHAEAIGERHRAARAERRVEIEPARDGMAWLHALLPADDVVLIKDRLDRVAHAAAADSGDDCSADQLRADAARDLLLHGGVPPDSEFSSAVAAARPTVHVTVPVLTLIGASEEPGLLDGYGPIAADTARRLAAIAPSFTRLLTDPVSGTVLDVDRRSYRPPADLKRWLEVRDGTCRFPGCNRRAARCEVDHTVDWQHDGRTAFDNLAHLCSLHHHLKHETAWSVRHQPGGVLEWTSPSGRTHITEPSHSVTASPAPLELPARADSDAPLESDAPPESDATSEADAPTASDAPPESPPF